MPQKKRKYRLGKVRVNPFPHKKFIDKRVIVPIIRIRAEGDEGSTN
jgi:hypothetical protein